MDGRSQLMHKLLSYGSTINQNPTSHRKPHSFQNKQNNGITFCPSLAVQPLTERSCLNPPQHPFLPQWNPSFPSSYPSSYLDVPSSDAPSDCEDPLPQSLYSTFHPLSQLHITTSTHISPLEREGSSLIAALILH